MPYLEKYRYSHILCSLLYITISLRVKNQSFIAFNFPSCTLLKLLIDLLFAHIHK